jgi:hypothetical protein
LKTNFLQCFILIALIGLGSCQRMEVDPAVPQNPESSAKISATLSEGFETGTKTAYTAADVTLSTGI